MRLRSARRQYNQRPGVLYAATAAVVTFARLVARPVAPNQVVLTAAVQLRMGAPFCGPLLALRMRLPRQRQWARAARSPVGETSQSASVVLGVAPGATKEEIRARFRRLAATEHPDKFPGDLEAAVRFQRITSAYGELMADPPPPDSAPAARAAATVAPLSPLEHVVAQLLRTVGLTGNQASDGFSNFIAVGVGAFLIFAAYFLLNDPERFVMIFFPPGQDMKMVELQRLGIDDPEQAQRILKYMQDEKAKGESPWTVGTGKAGAWDDYFAPVEG